MKSSRAQLLAVIGCTTALAVILTLISEFITGVFVFLAFIFVSLAWFFFSVSAKPSLARVFELPAFLTIVIVVSFGLAPLQAFLSPTKLHEALHGELSSLVTSLLLVILGMIAFWVACIWFGRRIDRGQRVIVVGQSHNRATVIALLLYLAGFECKTLLLRAHMFAYTTSFQIYDQRLAEAQLLMVGSQLGLIGLTMIAIEHAAEPARRVTRWLFWVLFAAECGWGVISGMKETLLVNFLVVAVVFTLFRGRLSKKWLLAGVLGLVAVYPFYNSYREVLRGRSSDEVVDFSSAAGALSRSITEAFSPAGESWLERGSDSTVSRLDLLQYVAIVISLGDQSSELHGEERLWMIPIYPFIPRLIWPSKPILDQGQRFSEMLGAGRKTSTAVPYFADCFIYGGIPGLIGGMFILGLVVQLLTNSIYGVVSKYNVLQYAILLATCFNIQFGAFMLWTNLLKTLALLLVVRYLAYPAIRIPKAQFNPLRSVAKQSA